MQYIITDKVIDVDLVTILAACTGHIATDAVADDEDEWGRGWSIVGLRPGSISILINWTGLTNNLKFFCSAPKSVQFSGLLSVTVFLAGNWSGFSLLLKFHTKLGLVLVRF